MKAMKAPMKAMKAMKAMKVSKIAKGKNARAVVFRGGKEKTSTGLTKDRLMKNKSGRIVSKAASARGKKAWSTSPLKKWIEAVKQARKQLNITGFCAVNGKTEGAVCQGQEHLEQLMAGAPPGEKGSVQTVWGSPARQSQFEHVMEAAC